MAFCHIAVRRWKRRSGMAAALALAFTGIAGEARADASGDARELFARGRSLRLHGDCASALPLFRQAYATYPAGLGSLRNIAECEESMAHFASARRAWLDLGRALVSHHDQKYEGWATDAEQGTARLASKLATLTVDVDPAGTGGDGAAAPAALAVTINGERLVPELVGAPLERDPGRYFVHLDAGPNRAPENRVVDLAPGDDRHVDLRVPPTGLTMATRETPVTRAMQTAGWIAVGVGGASLVGAAVALVARQNALDDLNRACPSLAPAQCMSPQPDVQSIQDRGHLASTLANVFGAVGVVGAVGGVVLLASGRSHPGGAALVVTPGGISAAGRF